MTEIFLLDDNPATEDLLGFQRMSEILYGVIKNPPLLPFTLGIFGEWGSGKTTLMKMMERSLRDDGIKTVWFNAWKYDSKEVIWNALIQRIFWEMLNDVEFQAGEEGERFRTRVAAAAKGLARYAAKVATRFIPGNVIREEDVDALVDTLSSSATDELFSFINRFEDEFDELVEKYVGEGSYLVVFVDDLDRCLPENAINVMEALKLYLDRANCIFVIGAESGIIEEGIRQRYRDNVRLSAEDYLDKIVQLPFVLPQADADSALSLLGVHGDLPIHKSDAMRTLIFAGTGGNPRRVKRFVNALWVLSKISGDPGGDDQLRLAKVLMLQMRFPQLSYRLVDDLGLAQSLTEGLMANPMETKSRRANSPEPVQKLYDDPELANFLLSTHAISMQAKDIRRWVMLTKFQASGAGEVTASG